MAPRRLGTCYVDLGIYLPSFTSVYKSNMTSVINGFNYLFLFTTDHLTLLGTSTSRYVIVVQHFHNCSYCSCSSHFLVFLRCACMSMYNEVSPGGSSHNVYSCVGSCAPHFTSHIYSSLGHLPVFYDIHKSCRERFTRNIFRLMLIARFIVLMLLATDLYMTAVRICILFWPRLSC